MGSHLDFFEQFSQKLLDQVVSIEVRGINKISLQQWYLFGCIECMEVVDM